MESYNQKLMESYLEDYDIHLITYITIPIIFIFKAHGNYSIPQAHHLNYDVIIKNHKHYLWYGVHHFQNSKCCLQRHFETYLIILNITTHCPKTHYKYLWKPKIFTNNKSSWGMKTHGNMCCWCPFCRMNTTQPKGTSPHEQAQSKEPQ